MTIRPCLAQHAALPALAGLSLLALLAAALGSVSAQDPDAGAWEPPAALPFLPGPTPRAAGHFSLEGSLGPRSTGAGVGLRVSLGFHLHPAARRGPAREAFEAVLAFAPDQASAREGLGQIP